jgi:hypothetical protein
MYCTRTLVLMCEAFGGSLANSLNQAAISGLPCLPCRKILASAGV